MISEFRSDLATLLDASTGLAVHFDIPDDVALLPCVVVGRVSIAEGDAAAILDLFADVFVVGRSQSAGGRDVELDESADEVLDALGGTRAIKTGDTVFQVSSVRGSTVTVASVTYPCYILTVESSAVTC